jgi:hypothetical protein
MPSAGLNHQACSFNALRHFPMTLATKPSSGKAFKATPDIYIG